MFLMTTTTFKSPSPRRNFDHPSAREEFAPCAPKKMVISRRSPLLFIRGTEWPLSAPNIPVKNSRSSSNPFAYTSAMAELSTAVPAASLQLRVNGAQHSVHLDPRTTLLDALREHLGLYGTKKGCDQGQCGACTVHVNGRRTLACLSLAVAHQHDEIVTIEGLPRNGALHPMQQAFLEFDGFQCGYCTPGQIMSAVALLAEAAGRSLSPAEIRENMSGNICRCGAYPNIVAAIQHVQEHS
jgi:xanthine dehydrogenase YagT iron-sulfur-binding subunit